MSKLWFGCVEDRKDPLFIGRCKVRIVGLHTDNKLKLPTDDLPWATPLQPIYSAGMSGVGHAPVGPVEGSWVAVQFLDSENQYPIMIGTLAGIPGKSLDGDGDGGISNQEESIADVIIPPNAKLDAAGVPETKTDGTIATVDDGADTGAPYLGRMTKAQYDKMVLKIESIESGAGINATLAEGGGNYSKTFAPRHSYIGKYQVGVSALVDCGYCKNTGTSDWNKAVWTGQGGCTSVASFLANGGEQEKAMHAYIRINVKYLSACCKVRVADAPPQKLAGLIAVAHNQGFGAVTKMLSGGNSADGNGVSAAKYYLAVANHVSAASGIVSTKETPTYATLYDDRPIEATPGENTANPLPGSGGRSPYDVTNSAVAKERSSTQTARGFEDPLKRYPRVDYAGEADTSRLARVQKINRTYVGQRTAQRIPIVQVANGGGTWYEPAPAYNAEYPYNHVFESECGHVMEFDDTPKAERVTIVHTTGTYWEVDPDGNSAERIKGSRVVVVDKDELVYIQGSGHITVDGDLSIKVKTALEIDVDATCHIHVTGNASIVCDANLDLTVKKDMTTVVEGNKYEHVKGEYNIVADHGLKLKSGGHIDFVAQGNFAVDAKYVQLNSGSAKAAKAQAPAEHTFTAKIVQPAPVSYSETSGGMGIEDSPTGKREAWLTPSGPMVASEPAAAPAIEGSTEGPPPASPSYNTNCPLPAEITPNLQLSTRFTMAMLTKTDTGQFNYKDVDKVVCRGVTGTQIACNLKKLAINIIEPIFDKYAALDPRISSPWRKWPSYLKSSETSQHNIGQAVDLQFGKIFGNKEKYYNLAKEIFDNQLVPFNQFLLETRGGSVWIHISYGGSALPSGTFHNDTWAPGGRDKIILYKGV